MSSPPSCFLAESQQPPPGAAGALVRCPGQDSNLRPSAPEADALSTELPGPGAELYQCAARKPKPSRTPGGLDDVRLTSTSVEIDFLG